MSRIIIAGGVGCGKTTYSRAKYPGQVWHTDDIIPYYDWEFQPDVVVEWLNQPGPWVIEGITATRALHHWLQDNPEGKPCDKIHWFSFPLKELTRRQSQLSIQMMSRWKKIYHELAHRGVIIVYE